MSWSAPNNLQSGQNNSNQAPAVEIIRPPPKMRAIIENIALFVSKNGLKYEREMIASSSVVDNTRRLDFLKSSDPYHAFYQQKLTQYRAQKNQEEAQAAHDYDYYLDASDIDEDEGEPYEPYVPPKYIQPHKFTFGVPEGMMSKELALMKLTALFVAQYGKHFVNRVSMNPQFEFMTPTASSFNFFTRLVEAYTEIMPREHLKETLRADVEAVLSEFFHRLSFHEQQWEKEKDERVEMATIQWHPDSVGEFANKEDEELPPPPPEPKREIVQGFSTIRVSVPNVDDGQVVEITVKSYMDNSLAHYNVKTGEFVRLSI